MYLDLEVEASLYHHQQVVDNAVVDMLQTKGHLRGESLGIFQPLGYRLDTYLEIMVEWSWHLNLLEAGTKCTWSHLMEGRRSLWESLFEDVLGARENKKRNDNFSADLFPLNQHKSESSR